jgi:alkylation response protein AidB-like acyl-CoA dehydrogenase
MSTELGLHGIIIPESAGGSGGSFGELVVVLEEMGRALCCLPYFSTAVLGVLTLLQACQHDDTVARSCLTQIATGEITGTLAVAEETGRWDPSEIGTSAEPDGTGWRLDGSKLFVIDGCTADLILVAAQAPEGPTIFAVHAGAAGLHREPMKTLDQTRKQARLQMNSTPADLVGRPGQGVDVLDRVADLAGVALAAEQLGGARQCLEMAVAHAKNRVQFGHPIGSFQAVQHRLSDMLLDVELCDAGVRYASRCAVTANSELSTVAPLVQAHAADTYVKVATEMIQILGGVGFTWEHPAHLYFRRATSSASLLGDPVFHRERLASRIGLGERDRA